MSLILLIFYLTNVIIDIQSSCIKARPHFAAPNPASLLILCSDNKILTQLLRIEPEKVYAMPDPSLPDDEYKLMATLSDLADRELVATIGWAKQVPG